MGWVSLTENDTAVAQAGDVSAPSASVKRTDAAPLLAAASANQAHGHQPQSCGNGASGFAAQQPAKSEESSDGGAAAHLGSLFADDGTAVPPDGVAEPAADRELRDRSSSKVISRLCAGVAHRHKGAGDRGMYPSVSLMAALGAKQAGMNANPIWLLSIGAVCRATGRASCCCAAAHGLPAAVAGAAAGRLCGSHRQVPAPVSCAAVSRCWGLSSRVQLAHRSAR